MPTFFNLWEELKEFSLAFKKLILKFKNKYGKNLSFLGQTLIHFQFKNGIDI